MSRSHLTTPVPALVAAALIGAGCGGGGGDGASSSAPPLVVSSDTALKAPITKYGSLFGTEQQAGGALHEPIHKAAPDTPQPKLSFGDTKRIAEQVRKGAKPDVVVGEAPAIDALYTAGLVEEPIRVTAVHRDELTLVTGRSKNNVFVYSDALEPGVRLAIVATPNRAGVTTRTQLGRLPQRERRAVLANVRLSLPDAAAVSRAILRGRADAGFIYRSELAKINGAGRLDKTPLYEVTPSSGRGPALRTHQRGGRPKVRPVTAIPALQPTFTYSAAVVRGARNALVAKAFVYGLLDGNSNGQVALMLNDFGTAPPITGRPKKPPPGPGV